jgi:hypothetical protein
MTNQVTRLKDNVLVYRNSDSEILEQRGRCIASRYLEIINYYNLGEGFERGPQRARVSGLIVTVGFGSSFQLFSRWLFVSPRHPLGAN